MKENFTDIGLEFGKTLLGVILFVLIVRVFIIQPFYVIGSSMEPNYQDGNYLIVDELTYKFREAKRGEVLVFRHPEEQCTAFINSNSLVKNIIEGPCQSYIKRVVGLPGETIEINNGRVKITNDENKNGFFLEEKYIKPGINTLGNVSTMLGKDEYFVIGDNREPNASSDSREWGPLAKKYVIGKVAVRLFPFNEIGIIPKIEYNN